MVFRAEMLPFLCSVAISILLAGFALQHREVRSARSLGWLMVCMAIWAGAYALSYSSVAIEDKRFWTTVKYLGAAPGPALWVVFAFRAVRADQFLTTPVVLVLWGWVATVLFAVFTNPWLQLFWKDLYIEAGRMEAVAVHGPVFAVYEYGIIFGIGFSILMFANALRTAPRLYRPQAVILMVAALVPLIGRILTLQFGIEILPGVDPVSLLLIVSGILFAIGIFRYDVLDVLALANRLVVDQIRAGVVVLDHAQRVISINQYARDLCVRVPAEGDELAAILPAAAELVLEDGVEDELEFADRKGAVGCYLVRVSEVGSPRTGRLGYALMLLDITARKAAERALEVFATTDGLTGASNRRKFFELAEREFAHLQRGGGSAGVLMIDVDHFKAFNDTHGHAVGDEVLRAVARACMETMREVDIFARYGGEEFVAWVDGDVDGVRRAAERVRAAVAARQVQGAQAPLGVTCSVGAAMIDAAGLQAAIERADAALYVSKRDGRNRVTLADPTPQTAQGAQG
ncbi:MAG TPA: histidine kinase N-terminal 7TM domain-containing protein [Pseudomonadales bacterium]|nr:histidine kinase N-terminal 7TM domain-containing protein [Pseudomonadales bacterium]